MDSVSYMPNKVVHNKNRKLNSLFQRLFPYKTGVNFADLRLTEEGIYSISKPNDSEIISQGIEKIIGKDIVITDATANVGGNCINFAESFKYVNAVEIDDTNFSVLKKNITVFGLESKVKFLKGNYLTVFDKLKQDVIFIDAPWGGRSYKDVEILDIGLVNSEGVKIYIGNIVYRLMKERHVKLVVLKVPYNFSFKKFESMMKDYKVEKYGLSGYFILHVYFHDVSV